MTRWLDAGALIAINARLEGGVGVRDADGVDSAAHRPQAEHFGTKAFPTLWLQAAAYAHGIASTQHFFDGNKRTAWLAAVMFLQANDRALPLVPDIEAELFINAVALDAWRADGPHATIEKAAEWFHRRYLDHRGGRSEHPLFEFVALAVAAEAADAVLNVQGGWLVGGVAEKLPFTVPLSVVGRLHYDEDAARGAHRVSAELIAPAGARVDGVQYGSVTIPNTVRSGPTHLHRTGFMPVLWTIPLRPRVSRAGDYTVRVEMDGEHVAALPYRVDRGLTF